MFLFSKEGKGKKESIFSIIDRSKKRERKKVALKYYY